MSEQDYAAEERMRGSAKEMYHALRIVSHVCEGSRSPLLKNLKQLADAVIAKAEGRHD